VVSWNLLGFGVEFIGSQCAKLDPGRIELGNEIPRSSGTNVIRNCAVNID